MVLRSREIIARVVQVAVDVVAERRAVRRCRAQEPPRRVLFRVVRQPLVEPQILGEARTQQGMLVEADHVLEFVDEGRRHDLLDLRNRMRAAQRTDDIRNDRIEDFPVVPCRELAGRYQIGAEEVSGDVPLVDTVRRSHERVHLPRHEHDHLPVLVDIRLVAERQRVRFVQERVEHGAQIIEIRLCQAGHRRRVVHVDRDVRSHLEGRCGHR